MKRWQGAVLLLLVPVLAACTAPPVPPPTLPPAPALVFGGDCASALDDAVVAEIFDEATASPVVTDPPRLAPALATLGGISCSWKLAADLGASLWIAPAGAVEAAESSSVDCEWNFRGDCFFEAARSGYWVGGIITSRAGTDFAVVPEQADGLVDAVLARASETAPPEAPSAAGAWSAQSCFALSRNADVPAVVGDASLRYRDAAPSASRRDTIVSDAAGQTTCEWVDDAAAVGFTADLVPEAGWLVETVAGEEGSRPVTIDGARAVVVGDGAGASSLWATDGVNLLVLRQSHPGALVDRLVPVARALLRAAS
jgi:hypothetical protein